MNDTPRTDAVAQFISNFGWGVPLHFSAQLERELAAMTAERDELRYALLEARNHLRAIGHRPETCYASSVIDAAIAASKEKP